MKKGLIVLMTFMSFIMTYGQSYDDFKKDFEKALNKNFSETEINKMFDTYSRLLTPESDVTELTANLEGTVISKYPLNKFKSESLYKDNIAKLINSENPYQRILAYLVIGSSGDLAYEKNLLEKIKIEKDKGNLIWAGMALMYLNTKHTTELFDFLVENEDFGDAHMLPLFVKLNKDSLQQTAYLRIKSDSIKAKVLAAQILSETKLNPKTDELLREAVKNWDINIKGYAIYSVKELQMGNLLELLKPLLDSSQTRKIAFEALANSPTKEDRDYLNSINNKDTVSEEFLDGLFESRSIENIKHWLVLLYTKPIPYNYVFFVFKQPLLTSDKMLPDVQLALEKIENPEIIHSLVRALDGRKDDKSTEILLKLIHHPNSTVRYWSARALKGNDSPKLLTEIPDLIKNPDIREVSFTNLAIDNKINNLQAIYDSIYLNNPNLDWKRSSIEYLSKFPKSRHRDIFRKLLEDKKEDFSIRYDAALGLGRLKDESSVDLIIDACERETKRSDLNARNYLLALSLIKGDKAKSEVLKFSKSKEENVRKIANKLLKNWDENKEINIYE